MKKTYILTEEQLNLVVEIEKKLLIESDLKSFLSNRIKQVSNFGKKFEDYFIRKFPKYFSLYIGYTSIVPGFALPIYEYVKKGNFDISEDKINLIISGVIAKLVFDNRSVFENILKEIEEKGLKKSFDDVLTYSNKLKINVVNLLQNSTKSIAESSEFLSVCFLLPIFSYIVNNKNASIDGNMIIKLLLYYGVSSTIIKLVKLILTQILSNIKNDIITSVNRKLPKAEPGSAEDYFFG